MEKLKMSMKITLVNGNSNATKAKFRNQFHTSKIMNRKFQQLY